MGIKFSPTNYRDKRLRDMGIAPPDWNDDEQVRAVKRAEMGYMCEQTIYAGVDVETSLGVKHFSLQTHDQTELMAQLQTVKEGAETVPYHADGEFCRYWSAEDFAIIAQAAITHIFYHRTYCNCLNMWIRRADREEFEDVKYGDELPEDIAEYMAAILEGKNVE